MNRKILSAAVLAVVTALTAPLVLADRGDRSEDHDESHEVYVHQVENNYYYNDHDHDRDHDRGYHRRWYKHEHQDYREYREPEMRYSREDYRGYPSSGYPARNASSPVPIIAGSVIGGVLGHELGRGNPGDTAVGAVIGTIIGYEIVRNRDR